MAFLFKSGTARSLSLSRLREGAAALHMAGSRSSAAAPWTAIRESSNLSRDDFIRQAIDDPKEAARRKKKRKQTKSTELESPPPNKVRMVQSVVSFRKYDLDKTFRKYGVNKTSNSITPEERQKAYAERQLVKRVPTTGPDPSLLKHIPGYPDPEPLIRKYNMGGDRYSWTRKGAAPNGREDAPTIFTFPRPRTAVLEQLPPGTTCAEIVQALEDAVGADRLPHRVWRLENMRVDPALEGAESTTARVEFMHPTGAEALRFIVSKGQLQVRGVVPTVFLEGDAPSPQPTSETGIGIVASKQERQEHLGSHMQRKIARRTPLSYN